MRISPGGHRPIGAVGSENRDWDHGTRYITRSLDYIVQLKRPPSGGGVIDEVLSTQM